MGGAETSSQKWRALLWPGICALIAFGILMSLGIWQMQRLEWKEGLLANIATRTQAAPVSLPSLAQWEQLARSDYEYTRVSTSGVFEHKWEMLIFRPIGGTERQPGYQVLTPLRVSGSDAYVLINRGFVPETLKAPAARMAGQVTGEVRITGLLRAPESRSAFTPADTPSQGLWYTRDPLAVARHLGLANMAAFSIDADEAPNPGGWPKGGATVISIKNDHRAYAATWFGLAATLLAVFGVFAWRRVMTG